MISDNENVGPRIKTGRLGWLSNPLHQAIEEAVSRYKGSVWQIKSEKDFSEFACHQSAILSDNSSAVFFKYSKAIEAEWQFENELSSLQILAKKAGIMIPQPIGIVQSEAGTMLIMKALEAITRGRYQWQQIGDTYGASPCIWPQSPLKVRRTWTN